MEKQPFVVIWNVQILECKLFGYEFELPRAFSFLRIWSRRWFVLLRNKSSNRLSGHPSSQALKNQKFLSLIDSYYLIVRPYNWFTLLERLIYHRLVLLISPKKLFVTLARKGTIFHPNFRAGNDVFPPCFKKGFRFPIPAFQHELTLQILVCFETVRICVRIEHWCPINVLLLTVVLCSTGFDGLVFCDIQNSFIPQWMNSKYRVELQRWYIGRKH